MADHLEKMIILKDLKMLKIFFLSLILGSSVFALDINIYSYKDQNVSTGGPHGNQVIYVYKKEDIESLTATQSQLMFLNIKKKLCDHPDMYRIITKFKTPITYIYLTQKNSVFITIKECD